MRWGLFVLWLLIAPAGALAQSGGRSSSQIIPSPEIAIDSPVPRFGSRSIYGQDRTAAVGEEGLQIPPLIAPTLEIIDIGSGQAPTDFGAEALERPAPLPEGPEREGLWSLNQYAWHPSNTYSHPLYFEDAMLERHGHERFPALQPFVSGARFFTTVPLMPYLMTVRPACVDHYSLGHFRPGTPAPALLQRPPYQRDAVVVQGLVTAGGFLIIP